MDDVDRQILEHLRVDGRMSNVEIARRVGVSEGTVRKRVGRLLDDDVVRVQAVTQDDAHSGVRVLLELRVHAGRRDEAVAALAEQSAVQRILVTTGDLAVVAEGAFRDTDALLAAVDALERDPAVEEVLTRLVLRLHDHARPTIRTAPGPSGGVEASAAPASRLESLIDTAFSAATSELNTTRVALHFVENGVPVYAGSRNLSPEYLLDSTRSSFEHDVSDSPVLKAVATGETVCISDALEAPTMAHMRGAVEAEGIRALIVVPLHDERGRTIATLTLYGDTPRQWRDRDVADAVQLGDELSRHIGRRRSPDAENETLG